MVRLAGNAVRGSLAGPLVKSAYVKLTGNARTTEVPATTSGRIVGNFHEKAGRVKPFFGRAIRTADCRPIEGIVILSFVERFFGSAIDTADRRPAGDALCSRFLLQLPSPTRPTSIRTLGWSFTLRCQLVFSICNGCCRLGAELRRFRFWRRSFLADAAVTRTLRLGQTLSGSYLLSLLP
jgi:hypothetical protein